jgi:large subunit ribosomal protein L10
MPSQKNTDQVAIIKANLEKAQNLIIADYAGLDSAAQTDLRAKVKAAGGEFTVTKNRLVKIVLKERLKDLPADLDKSLEGPNATLYGFSDPVAATKVLVEFAKDHETLNVKMGLMIGHDGAADQILSSADIKSLAALPSKNELLAHLVGQLNAPIYGLVNVMAGNLRKVVYVLNAIKDQKAVTN